MMLTPNRMDYSPIIDRPVIHWPDSARVAFWVAPNADFCVEALEEALSKGRPENFNTDQGSQFIGVAFAGLLERHGVRISMDGKGRYTDPDYIGVERLWRTVK